MNGADLYAATFVFVTDEILYDSTLNIVNLFETPCHYKLSGDCVAVALPVHLY